MLGAAAAARLRIMLVSKGSYGFVAVVGKGSLTFRPVPADSYAAKMASSTARPSSPVTSGLWSLATQSTKWAISCGKP